MKFFVAPTIPLFSVQVYKANAMLMMLPMGSNGHAHHRFDVDRVRLVIVA